MLLTCKKGLIKNVRKINTKDGSRSFFNVGLLDENGNDFVVTSYDIDVSALPVMVSCSYQLEVRPVQRGFNLGLILVSVPVVEVSK